MVSLHLAAVLLAVSSPGETVLLDFQADWCGPCRAMDATVERLAAGGYSIKKVNIDHERDLARRYNINGVPTFVLLVDGREVDRVVGVTSFERLKGMIDQSAAMAQGRPRAQSPDPFFARAAPPPVDDPPLTDIDNLSAKGWPDGAPRTRSIEPSPFIRASVRLKIENGSGSSVGSGTIIDMRAGEALILTCGHVFRDAGNKGVIWVELFGAGTVERVRGELVSYDDKNDVGLVSIHTRSRIVAARVAPVEVVIEPGAKVVSVGCDHGADPTERPSHVTSVNKYAGTPNLQVAGQPVQGRSGGGLFTPDGYVVGVCNAADPADNEGLFAALPAIYAELDRNGLSYVYKPTQRPAAMRGLAAAPPKMPQRMPPSAADRAALTQVAPETASVRGQNDSGVSDLSAEEQAALAELREKSQGGEIICIMQPPDGGKSEIIIIKQASPAFLEHLAAERQTQPSRKLTSLELPAEQRQR